MNPLKPQLQSLAQFGRNGDTELVHMHPAEVDALRAIAKANGTQVTTNPVTGAPEAYNLLPLMVGLGAGAMGMGPLAAGLISGGLTTATTHDLKQGLMAGLTGGSLAGMTGNALSTFGSGAGNAAAAAAPTATAANSATTFAPSATNAMTLGGGMANSGFDAGTAASLGQPVTDSMVTPTLSDKASAYLDANKGNLMRFGVGALSGGLGYVPAQTPPGPPKVNLGGLQYRQTDYAHPHATGPVWFDSNVQHFKLGGFIRDLASLPVTATRAVTGGARDIGNDATSAMQSLAGVQPQQSQGAPTVDTSGLSWTSNTPNGITAPNVGQFGVADTSYIRPVVHQGFAGQAYAQGGVVDPMADHGDGTADQTPAVIDGKQPAALGSGEYVVRSDVVSGLGNGSTMAGVRALDAMQKRVLQQTKGNAKAAPPMLKPHKVLPR